MGRIVSDGIDFEAKVSIHRMHGGDGTHPIRIEIEDATSGTRVCEISMSLENFAEAITGLSACKAKGHLWDGPVGYKSEYKIVNIFMPSGYVRTENQKAVGGKYLAPYEVDGWKGRVDDLFNHHKNSGENTYRVSFHRHVHPETGEPWERETSTERLNRQLRESLAAEE